MAGNVILGKKIGMTQIFSPDGMVTPVTAIEAGPCVVGQHRTAARDNYTAIQVGFDVKRKRSVNKPEAGHWKKAGADARRFVRELRVDAATLEKFPVGFEFKADVFKPGDFVDVIGTSKGRGFTGGVKRHHWAGMVASHGAHEYMRHGGALGGHTFPGRTIRGMTMPGRHGGTRSTARNLEVMRVDIENSLLYVKGAVAGPPNGYLYIRTAKTRKPRPPAPPKHVAEAKKAEATKKAANK